jgi:predicted PurR-regulated permease PerM
VGLAGLIVVITALKAASGLLTPVLLAIFIVLACMPLVNGLRSLRVPDWLNYTLVTLMVCGVGLLFAIFFAVSVESLSSALPTYGDLLSDRIQALRGTLQNLGVDRKAVLSLEFLQPGYLIGMGLSFIQGALGAATNLGLTLFVFIYMLVESQGFGRKLAWVLRDDPDLLRRFRDIGQSISMYLLIKGWLGAITALFQTILLAVIGVDFAVLWGILSFLFNFVPNIGYIIALLPPMILALIQFGFPQAVMVFVGYAVINNFFDMVIGPRYLGKGLDLSTMVTFLAVLVWTWILGPIGAFMALPLTVMLKKLVLDSFADTQGLSQLIGSREAIAPTVATATTPKQL